MSSIRKRLVAIRDIIATANFSELLSEVNGLLEESRHDSRFLPLKEAAEMREYNLAAQLTDGLLSAFQPPVLNKDVLITGLKTSLNLLETKLSVLNHHKLELHRHINEFRFLHNKYLGSLMAEIFELRRDILFIEYQENASNKEAFDEAEKDLGQFNEERSRVSEASIQVLSRRDRAELTSLYRQASKRCHPDLIAEELREEATLLFIRLNEAYLQSDLEGLRAVIRMLDEGTIRLANRMETLHEEDKLLARITHLQTEISHLEKEIAGIKESRVYQTILHESDLHAYFTRLEEAFIREREVLRTTYESRKGADS